MKSLTVFISYNLNCHNAIVSYSSLISHFVCLVT